MCSYFTVLGLYCSQINNLIYTSSNSLWHCILPLAPSDLANLPLCSCNISSQQDRIHLTLPFLGIWTFLAWTQLSNALQAMPASLHVLQQLKDQAQICTSHHHDGQVCSVSCLFSLKNFVPQEIPTGTVILGSFFHWLLWVWKEACEGRLTLPFIYYPSAEKLTTIRLCLIMSLSFH